MHGTLPVIPLSGPEAPGAFENLCVMKCPPYADALCPVCKGHGAYNTHLNGNGVLRHRFVECDTCRGDGWVENDGEVHVQDIVLINGSPRWVVTLCRQDGFEMRPKRAK